MFMVLFMVLLLGKNKYVGSYALADNTGVLQPITAMTASKHRQLLKVRNARTVSFVIIGLSQVCV